MLVGRERELEVIRTVLAGAASGTSGALLVRGEAGIGKTELLEEARRLARGFRVLRVTGSEAEAELPYAGLHQLVQAVTGEIGALPGPQAAALRAALGLEERAAADRMLVGLGLLTLLAVAAEEAPVLCLVDDAQWVDGESCAAIGFVARRLVAERVALLFAVRDGAGRPFPFPREGELPLGPLARADARRLLRSAHAARVPDEASVLDEAQGNPLALLELGRRAAAGDTRPSSVEEAYAEAVRRLPEPTQAILLLAAAGDGELRALAEAAPALGAGLDDLTPAERAGLLSVGDGRVRFRHPLVRTAVYTAEPFTRRRRAHLALADALDATPTADRCAWHRAAAATGPDEPVAAALEASAERALRRSGYAAAAAALDRAGRLTPDPGERARRLVAAAETALLAGSPDRALAVLDEARDVDADVATRVIAARIRGVVESQRGSPARAMRIFLDAATAAYPADRALTLELVTLAQEAAGLAGAIQEIVELGAWADRLGPPQDAGERIALGLLRGFTLLLSGDRDGAAPALREAVETAAEVDDPKLLVWAGTAGMFLGDDRAVLDVLGRAVSEARARGALSQLPFALVLLAGAERRLGDLAAAEADADEALRLAREIGHDGVAAGALATLTALAAFRGDVDRAEALGAETRRYALPRGLVVPQFGVARALAELELSRGRADQALARLQEALGGPDERLVNQPFALLTTGLLAEAAARARTPAVAAAQVAAFEEWAAGGGPPGTRAVVERCRALLAEHPADAERHYARALELHAAHPHPYETARTQLLYGELLRRARRKSEAREHLRAAADAFDAAGARLWAERATAELRATGATARKRDDSTRAELTPQELQIVRLVTQGRTNPEVGAQLFLSPKTVQYHLRKVFAKLNVASRNELTRLAAEGLIPGAEAAPDALAASA